MSEFAGLSYYAEVPAVVVNVQRVGPSTGLPTRTMQGDLRFVHHLSHGDTRHPVLLPASPSDCFDFGVLAFDLAEIGHHTGRQRRQLPAVDIHAHVIAPSHAVLVGEFARQCRRIEWHVRLVRLDLEMLGEQIEHFLVQHIPRPDLLFDHVKTGEFQVNFSHC